MSCALGEGGSKSTECLIYALLEREMEIPLQTCRVDCGVLQDKLGFVCLWYVCEFVCVGGRFTHKSYDIYKVLVR